MILIDKAQPYVKIILTLTELSVIDNPIFLLVLISDFNQSRTKLILSDNLSDYKSRCDVFQLPEYFVSKLDTGLYTYQVFELRDISEADSVLGNVIESGKAKVIAPDETAKPIIYEVEEPTIIYTYKSIND